MPKYTLDTNVFVDALRSPSAAVGLKQFLARSLSSTWMSAVVMMELRSGARTPSQVAELESGLLEPFVRRGRVLVPTSRAFREAGRVMADLAIPARERPRRVPASFVTDILLAVSCRETGITLVTRDADFETIARHIPGLRFLPPWP